MPLLEVTNLTVKTAFSGHAPRTLVNKVNFALEKGKTLALVGESGSGKTLTALSIMGLLSPDLSARAQSLSFNGMELQALSAAERRALRGREMAMIFQEPATALNPVLTCGYQVEEAFIIHGNLSAKQRHARVLELFEQVQLPNPQRIFASYPHQISGGQRQRVMIAMALAHSPKLLVADEPTTALDVTVQAEILKLVKSLQQQMGMAMLWITHDFGVVRELADDTVVLQNGQVVEEGPTRTILAKPGQPYTKELLAATLSLNLKPAAKTQAKAPILLEAEKLTHTYRRRSGLFGKQQSNLAVEAVSFELREGSTLGVVGESGSGKSTLARLITRLVEPAAPGFFWQKRKASSARLVFMGQDFLALKGKKLRAARRHMQMVFQDPVTSLNPKMKIGESVAEGVLAHNLLPKAEVAGYVRQLLQEVGLPEDAAERYPHQFSGGQRQRIAIARALALKPKLIIADEPVSALDVSVQSQILKLLQNVQKKHGTGFVFISHDLRVVSHMAENVLVMKDGRVVESGATATVFAKPHDPYTRKLLAAVI